MSTSQKSIDTALLAFQADALALARPYGITQVETCTHGSPSRPVRYFCRYQLPGAETCYEAPAGTHCADALLCLRGALAEHLGPPPASRAQ